MSAGKSFIKNELRTLAYRNYRFSAGASIKAVYEAKLVPRYPVGSKVTVQVTVINTNTGQAGVPSEVYVIIT